MPNLIESDLDRLGRWLGLRVHGRAGSRHRCRSRGRLRLARRRLLQIGGDGFRRLFLEEIAKLIFTELGCTRNQINARKLSCLGALAAIKQEVNAIRTPRNGIAAAVGEKADGATFAARDRHDIDVLE